MKIQIKTDNATMKTFPLPVTLVSCVDKKGVPNIITITYVTGVNEEPPIMGIAIGCKKYSNKLIKETGEFVINIPTKELLSKIDYCGTYSGKEVNKFQETGLSPEKAAYVKSPLIKECPINIECKVMQVINFPSHDLFIGKVVALHVDGNVLLNKDMPDFDKLDFLLTTFLNYHIIGKKVGIAFKEHQKR